MVRRMVRRVAKRKSKKFCNKDTEEDIYDKSESLNKGYTLAEIMN